MIEQMNRDIDLYMGEPAIVFKDINGNPFPDQPICDYQRDWSKLMPVWAKLRAELHETGLRHKMGLDGISTVDIEKEIAVYVDIKEAHKLIHTAILWLKNK